MGSTVGTWVEAQVRGRLLLDMSAAAGASLVFTGRAISLPSFRTEIKCTEQPSCWEGFLQGI